MFSFFNKPKPTPNIGQAATVLTHTYFYQDNYCGFRQFDFGEMYIKVKELSFNKRKTTFLVVCSITFSSDILVELLKELNHSIPIYLESLSRLQLRQLKQFLEQEGYQLDPNDQTKNSFYRNG